MSLRVWFKKLHESLWLTPLHAVSLVKVNLSQAEEKRNRSVTDGNCGQVFKATPPPPRGHVSFSADCACLSSSKPARQPLSQVKPAVTSAKHDQLAVVSEAVPTKLSTLCSLDKSILELKGVGYTRAAVPPSLLLPASQHLLIKSSNLKPLDVLGKAWSEAISSYSPHPHSPPHQ